MATGYLAGRKTSQFTPERFRNMIMKIPQINAWQMEAILIEFINNNHMLQRR